MKTRHQQTSEQLDGVSTRGAFAASDVNEAHRSTFVDEQRWAAVLSRTANAVFVYGVASTGVYCRPSCPSRRPRRTQVTFHDTALAAELAGFRPCKRCRPRDPLAEAQRDAVGPVVAMCRFLEDRDEAPNLRDLAQHVGLSASHAHRVFVRATGITPKQYREAIVRKRVDGALATSPTVTDAMYAAGFSAPSRFYEHVARHLGMAPRQYRRGADSVTIRFAVGECSLGSILVAATERGVCAVVLGDDPEALIHDLERRFPKAELVGADASFEDVVAQVVTAVEAGAPLTSLALPIDLRGTIFQERVWQALMAIPRGRTATYADVAEAIGAPTAARAVARACADNPIAVLIPCHRVVRADGSLSGYRWGVERKRALLARERSSKADEL